ncbi:MAG: M23 family metallopeptidase, partial [Actinobacteria bacterium]|nr:M23 family metallopeptidase [Actinomycetota bacterium]
MALDPQLVNPLQFARGFDLESLTTVEGIRQLILMVVMGPSGVLKRPASDTSTADEKTKSFDGPWSIQLDNGTEYPLPSASELAAAARRVRDAGQTLTDAVKAQRGLSAKADKKDVDAASAAAASAEQDLSSAVGQANNAFGVLVRAAQSVYDKAFPGSGSTAALLELVSDYKASYSVGKTMPGYYRYYSSAHPDPANQGMLRFSLKDGSPDTSGGRYDLRTTATQFSQDGTGLVTGQVTAGIPIATQNGSMVVKATHEIKSFDMARLEVTVSKGRVVQKGDRVQAYPFKDLRDGLQAYFTAQILDADTLSSTTSVDDFEALFVAERDRIAGIIASPDSVPPPPDVPDTVAPTTPGAGGGVMSIDVLAEAPGTTTTITSNFSTTDRELNVDGKYQKRPHKGTDLSASLNTPVLAPAPGKVTRATGTYTASNPGTGYGNVVYIDHADGYSTRYGHLNSVSVSVGNTVSAGQVIGMSGNTGSSTGPHLHFELLVNGTQVDPTRYRVSGTSFAP